MPNLAMSKRGPPVAIISMAQQASPNGGRPQLTLTDEPATFSAVVSRIPARQLLF